MRYCLMEAPLKKQQEPSFLMVFLMAYMVAGSPSTEHYKLNKDTFIIQNTEMRNIYLQKFV